MSEQVVLTVAGGYEKMVTQNHATRVRYVSPGDRAITDADIRHQLPRIL